MQLFENTRLGGIDVKNRVVRSATATFMADDKGQVTDRVKALYKDLSEGEIGLIIFEDTGVGESTLESKHLMINDDSYVQGYRDIVDQIHSTGGKTIIQLSHSGILKKGNHFIDVTDGFDETLITVEDIKMIVEMYGDAALRSQKAGFDGVQIHAAHGYFLTKFLSPFFNRRKDAYGGTIENRTRIVVEIFNTIKQKCGADYPVWLKLNSSDFMTEQNTNTLREAKEIALIMDNAGIDAIEVSGGVSVGIHGPARKKIFTQEKEAYHKDNAVEIAKMVSVPVIVVGGFRSVEIAEQTLQENNIEAVSLSRPLIREPHLVKRWMTEDTSKALCVSCNACFNMDGATCVFNRKKKA